MNHTPLHDPVANLNRAQRDAAEHGEGPLLILAGAGSGKTRVLTSRVANLMQQRQVPAARILAVTFTNKAAGELRDRISAIVGGQPPGMWVGTFHSVGARLLRLHADAARRTPSFTIYDSDDTIALVKRVMAREGIGGSDSNHMAVLSAISDAKNRLIDSQEFSRLARDPFSKTVAAAYTAMDAALRESNAVTFDDLLTLPVELLRNHAEIRARYQERFQHILVDEYQDTNHAQYKLVSILGAKHRNVCVVGDDDQSIYGWRGADIRNILEFERDFTGARIVRLEENYRSTPGILAVANAIISHNEGRRGKTLRAMLPPGEQPVLATALDERDEAEWIADEIALLTARNSSLQLSDVAVVYRTNAQSRILEEIFRRRGLMYRLVGAVGFYDRREIKDLLAWLRLISNPSDDGAFLRAVAVPRRGVGDTSLEQLSFLARDAQLSLLAASSNPEILKQLRPGARRGLEEFAALVNTLGESARSAPVATVLADLISGSGFLEYLERDGDTTGERQDNVRELLSSAAHAIPVVDDDNTGTPLDLFLQQSALVAGVDSLAADADAVTVMTVHNAKGLEFPVVFVSGLEDGLFPLARAFDQPAQLEEERRLLYVAVTRARSRLYLSYASSRRRNGELRRSPISSFLKGHAPGLWREKPTIRFRSAAQADSAIPYSPSRRPTYGVPTGKSADHYEDHSQDGPTITMGSRVKHASFGAGTISDVSGMGRDAKVTVDFDDENIGRKRLVLAYAGLQNGWDE